MGFYGRRTMKINEIPRINSCFLPTPLEKLDNLSKIYKNDIFMKRDDLTGHCFGGNKERKLEFIMADAVKKKTTVIVTVGTLQSNHCRMTVSFSNKMGLKTELIAIEKEESEKNGNYLLCELMNATVHKVKVNEVEGKIKELMINLKNQGERPYFIEGGGHSVLGTLGYIHAVKELKKQTKEMKITPDYIVLPTGTGTTQAGLILGRDIFDYDVEIVGISIARKKERCINEITSIVKETEKYLDIKPKNNNLHVKIYDEYIGEGYGIPSEKSVNAVKLLAEKEGTVIDPIYNAKSMAGMLDLISKQEIRGTVIFLNTGGMPNVFSKKGVCK